MTEKYQCDYCGNVYFNNSGRSKHYKLCTIKSFVSTRPMKGLVYIRPFEEISRDHISDEKLISIIKRPAAMHYRLVELIWNDVRNRGVRITDRRMFKCKVFEAGEWFDTDKEHVVNNLIIDNEKFVYKRKKENPQVYSAISKYQSVVHDYKQFFNLYGNDTDYHVEYHAHPTRLLRVQQLILNFLVGK